MWLPGRADRIVILLRLTRQKRVPEPMYSGKKNYAVLVWVLAADANGVLTHPWVKLRLRRTSCPPIAVHRKDCQILLTTSHKVPLPFVVWSDAGE